MKKFKLTQILRLSLIGIFITFIFGCSSQELSRIEAEKSIRVKEHLPFNDVRNINLSAEEGTHNSYHDSPNDLIQQEMVLVYKPTSANALFLNLQNEGLITYKIEIEVIENKVVWAKMGSICLYCNASYNHFYIV